MKRILSLLLAVAMSVSAVPTAFAADTQDHSLGTQVVFTAANNENYTITVPASLNPGQSGTVTLDGYWPDSKTVTVTAEKTVTLKNSIKAADTKTLNITFLGISEAGSNTSKQTFTEPVSVEGISNALFGTWSGKFNYNVDSVEEEVPPAENYIGTVSADNTITLSGVESAGTYTLRYANANGALENYADICSLEVTDPATAVSYDDLIAENCAPVEATSIAVYNADDEKVGDIALGNLSTNLGTKLYSFGALADTHIGERTINTTKVNNALNYLTESANVDFVCIPGDLTQNASDAEFQALKNIIDSNPVPIYVSTGNHDTRSYRGQSDDISDEVLITYTGHPMYYSFTQGDDVFIMMGVRNEAENLFKDEALIWLYETLEANKDKRCFVFQHVFPYEEGCGNAGDYYTLDIWGGPDAASFESLLTRYTNVIFFHGHSHTVFEAQTFDDMANYDNIRGSHSVHIPSVSNPRTVANAYDNTQSQGYSVEVYQGGIILRGLDFVNNKYLPIAQYCIETPIKESIGGAITIPQLLNLEHGKKLDKQTGAESTTTEPYSVSPMIPIESGVTYTVGLTRANYHTINICCYDANGDYIGYMPDVVLGPKTDGVTPMSVEITPLEGTAFIRLRNYTPIIESEGINATLNRYWMTKTFTVS